MRQKAKWSVLISILLVVSLFLTACGGADNNNDNGTSGNASNELADEQVLHLSASDDIPTLDSTRATDSTSFQQLYMLKSGLMTVYDNEPVPDMAKSAPKVNDKGTVYTFTLREDAKWSDGSPVTAQDFVFAWHRVLNPDTGSQYSYIFESAHIKNAAEILNPDSDMFGKVDKLGVKALDDKTLQVTLTKPTPYFVSLMSFPPFYPMKESFVKKQGTNYALEPANLLYNGAYKLKKWDHGSGWTLVKNEDYWDAEDITLDKVVYNVIKEQTTQLNLYKTGDLDVDGLIAEYVGEFKDSPEFHTALGNCVFFMKLSLKNVPAFNNIKVRQALSMALDRDGLTNILLNNGSIPAHYIVPKKFTFGPKGKDFREAAPEGYLLGSQEQATKLWNEAKQELGIDKLELEYATTDGPHVAKMAEYTIHQIEKTLPGVEIRINKQPWGSYLKLENSGNFDIAAGSGWCPDYQDPMTFLDMWTTGNPNNSGGWSNDKYDSLIKEASNLGTEPEKRWAKLQQAEELLIKKAPIIPTYQNGSSTMVKSYVKGLDFPSYGPDLDYRHVKIMKH